MAEWENKNNINSNGNLINLIHLYSVAIKKAIFDEKAINNKDKNEIKNIYNENKRDTDENDIVFELYNKKEFILYCEEKLKFIVDNCRSYLKISSRLIKELIKTNNKVLLDIILKCGIKFFDKEIIIKLHNYFKNKIPISDSGLNKLFDNDKYKIPLEWNCKYSRVYNSSHYLFNACKIGNEMMAKYLINH